VSPLLELGPEVLAPFVAASGLTVIFLPLGGLGRILMTGIALGPAR
jgi:hypothetical protein